MGENLKILEVLNAGLHSPRSYLVRGEEGVALAVLADAIQNSWGITFAGNPNISFFRGVVGVDEARELTDIAGRSAFGEDSLSIIFLAASRLTHEAQNALLKITEEPKSSLRMFVVVDNDVELLPTLLSRLEDITDAFGHRVSKTGNAEAEKFVSSGLKERLKVAEKIAKDEETHVFEEFLRNIEKFVWHSKFKHEGERKTALNAVAFAKKQASFQSRPKRMVLEALAISLPVL